MSKCFRRFYVTVHITIILNIVHYLAFVCRQNVSETVPVRSSGRKEKNVPVQLGPLEKATLDRWTLKSDDENTSSFRNIMFKNRRGCEK
jgi:hypothetical protein